MFGLTFLNATSKTTTHRVVPFRMGRLLAVAGYVAGGYGPSFRSDIDKIAFTLDTKTTLSATLTTALYVAAGFANSGTAGYVAGGHDSARISGIDKLTFPVDAKTTLSATLTSARNVLTGFANSGVAGYGDGGYNGS